MALGNNVSMGQGGGKNKATIIKRYKEVNAAKGYTRIMSTSMSGVNACSLSNGSNEYYHNGSGTFPAVNDIVYSKKRAGTEFLLPVGHYKMHVYGFHRNTKNIEINPIGVVKRVTSCP